MNPDDELEQKIRASLTGWADTVDVEPDIDKLTAARSRKPWDHKGGRLVAVAAAFVAGLLIATSVQSPDGRGVLGTFASDRSKPVPTTADPGDPDGNTTTTTTTTTTIPPTTPSSAPGGSTPPPDPLSPDDGSSWPGSGPGSGSESDAGSTPGPPVPGEDAPAPETEPEAGCPTGGVALNGGWRYRVRWGQGQDTWLALVDVSETATTRRLALYLSAGGAAAGDCYQRVTWSKDGTPTVVVMSTLANSATEIHTFGCRNPTLVMPDGVTTDGVTWTFQVREVSVTGTSARIVTNTTLTLREGESGDIDFFRRLDCDDSTPI